MARRGSLPCISSKPADPALGLLVKAPAPFNTGKQVQSEPTTSRNRAVVRRSLSGIPKSAGGASSSRRLNYAEVSLAAGKQLDGAQFQQQPRLYLQRPASTQSPPKRASTQPQVAHAGSATSTQFANWNAIRLSHEERPTDKEDGSQQPTGWKVQREALRCSNIGEMAPEGLDPQHLQQLRNENESLQQEVGVLRAKLLEKMRGRSKVIGGGQFRATSASSSSPASVGIAFPSAACTKFASARAGALKARSQHAQAQANAVELHKYVAKVEAMQQTLWAERAGQQAEILQLKRALAERDEECVEMQADRALLEKELRALGVEKETLESSRDDNNTPVDESTQCALDTPAQSDGQPSGSQDEVKELNKRLQGAMKQCSVLEEKLGAALADVRTAKEAARGEKERYKLEVKARLEAETAHSRRISEIEKMLVSSQGELTATTLQLRETHRLETESAQESIQQLRSEVTAKEVALTMFKQQHTDTLLACEARQQVRLKELEASLIRRTATESEVQTRLKTATDALTTSASAKVALQERVKVLEGHNEVQKREKRQSDAHVLQLQARNHAVEEECLEHTRLRKEQDEELLRSKEALNTAQQDVKTLQVRVSNAEFDVAERDELLRKLKQSHARALEHAVQSAVRLCVVAPTVNVHLNSNGAEAPHTKEQVRDTTSKLIADRTKKTTEVTPVTCRSSPPRDRIRQVVEDEVLPLFTRVFVQDGNDPSPQSDGVMAPWLEKLLVDMQARIASQLKRVYAPAT